MCSPAERRCRARAAYARTGCSAWHGRSHSAAAQRPCRRRRAAPAGRRIPLSTKCLGARDHAYYLLHRQAAGGSLSRRPMVTTAGRFTSTISRPPSTSRVTDALPPLFARPLVDGGEVLCSSRGCINSHVANLEFTFGESRIDGRACSRSRIPTRRHPGFSLITVILEDLAASADHHAPQFGVFVAGLDHHRH